MLRNWKHYARLALLCATQAFDGGVLYVLSSYALRLVQLAVLLLIWRSVFTAGADTGGMMLQQVLTYSLISSVFSEQLNVVTPASTSFWEGSIINRSMRPLPVLPQIMAETVGRWLPALGFCALPTLLAAPLLGVAALPATAVRGALFALSLALSISLGFAMDFIFASLAVRIKDASWMAHTIRNAVVNLFSGAVIPFALLPWGVGDVLSLLPFGSVAGAPLSIYVGLGQAPRLLALQIAWNAVLWPLALIAFRKSEERMVSFGG